MTARTAASGVVKFAAATIDTVRRPRRGHVVLLYHRVGAGSGSAVDLPVDLFRAQMDEIAARALSLDAALDELAGGSTSGHDVAITFDDGTADFVEHALPILHDRQLPAVVYLATDFIERGREFPWGAPPVSWAALADAHSTGLITFGSHSHTHVLFDRIDTATAADQLDRSVGLIGDRLGVDVAHFAYPKALAPNAAAEGEVRRRFRSAALAGTTANEPGRTDPHRLARSPIQELDGMRWFRRKAAGGMGFEDRLRRIVNRGRYAGAVT